MEDKIVQITRKFGTLRPSVTLTAGEVISVYEWLIELCDINLSESQLQNPNHAILLVQQLCSLVPADHAKLVSMSALTLLKLSHIQRVTLEGHILTLALEWLFNTLQYGVGPDYFETYARVLQAIEVIVRNNPAAEKQRGEIFKLMQTHSRIFVYCDLIDEDTRFALQVPVIRAFEALLSINHGAKDDLPDDIRSRLLPFFITRLARHNSPKGEVPPEGFVPLVELDFLDQDHSHASLLQFSLSGIRYLLEGTKITNLDEQTIRCILGMCRTYMVYELPNVPFLPPTELLPIPFLPPRVRQPGTPAPVAAPNTSRRRKRKPASRHVTSPRSNASSSTSDANLLCMTATFGQTPPYVDCSSFNPYLNPTPPRNEEVFRMTELGRTREALTECRVRLEALTLLQHLLSVLDSKTLCANFTAFMQAPAPPNGAKVVVPSGNNLPTCALKDPSPGGRLTAQFCMQLLLGSCKSLLICANNHLAEGENEMVPCSISMANIVEQLHHNLCLAMSDQSIKVLVQVLKTLSIVVQASSYDSLKSGLCTKLLRTIKQFVNHDDTGVQVGALTTIGALLAYSTYDEVHCAFEETSEIVHVGTPDELNVMEGGTEYANLESPAAPEAEDEMIDTSNPSCIRKPWVIETCLEKLNDRNGAPAPIKIECWQILSKLCDRYFKLQVYPYLPSMIKAIKAGMANTSNFDVVHHGMRTIETLGNAMAAHGYDPDCLHDAVIIWQDMLGNLISFATDAHPLLRSGVADLVGAIGGKIFDKLTEQLQLTWISVVISLAADRESVVKSAAVRAIGVLLIYDSARCRPGFIIDTVPIITAAMRHPNLSVRIRGSWALGNLSDALIQEDLLEEIFGDPDEYGLMQGLKEVILCAIEGASDQDKIRCNAVRALGNLLQLLNGDNEYQYNLLHDGVDKLLSCASQSALMKARWNACFALGNVLKMPSTYLVFTDQSLTLAVRIFTALGWILIYCTNIKVRIHAAMAVTSCNTRAGYGTNYHNLWGSLINGLITVENIVEANECLHRDKLVIQTCVTLGHLISLAMPGDLEILADVLSDGADTTLRAQLLRVMDQLSPENHTPLLHAAEHLAELEASIVGGPAMKGLAVLMGIFQQQVEDD